jgi:putative phage-type endonuclease
MDNFDDLIALQTEQLAASIPQRSMDWHQLRAGRITASKVSEIMKPKGFGISGMEYLRLKKWELDNKRGAEFSNYRSAEMQHGIDNEERALAMFTETSKVKIVDRPEFKTKGDYLGASVDGLTNLGYPVETKCLNFNNYLKHCQINNNETFAKVSFDYYCQVQLQMYVLDVAKAFFVVLYTPQMLWDKQSQCHVPERPNGAIEPLPDMLHYIPVTRDDKWVELLESRLELVVEFFNGIIKKEATNG